MLRGARHGLCTGATASYQIISVEGAQSCNTPYPALISNGNAHFVSPLPPGTVLNDDTGTDVDGRAAFVLAAPALLSASLPSLAGAGRVCVRLRQDPDHRGYIDCDGGSAFGVDLVVDSQGAGPSGTPSLSVGSGGDAGPGGAVLRVVVEAGITDDGVTPCEDATYAAPLHTAITTATATSTIVNAQQGGMTTVSQGARPFNCSTWVENAGASLAGPNLNMDVVLPLGLGTFDIAQVLRLKVRTQASRDV